MSHLGWHLWNSTKYKIIRTQCCEVHRINHKLTFPENWNEEMDHGAVSQFQEDDPYKNQPLLIQLVRLFTCCNVSLPGMNYKLQESTPYFDASTHPLASLYPCAPKNCLLPFWRNQGAQVLTFSIQMWKTPLVSALITHGLYENSRVPPGWAVVTVEAPCQWWNGPKDDLPDGSVEGRGAFHFGPAKNDLTELVCLEDFVKKNYCPHHFPFWCLASFFHSSKLSCRVCVILHCLL